MKKFINKPENVEAEMIKGLLKAYPDRIKELDCGSVRNARRGQGRSRKKPLQACARWALQ